VHGDLHAGNILFIKDEKETNEKLKYKLGILDLGIVFRVSNKLQSICYQCWNDLTDSKDIRDISESLINSDLFIVPLSNVKLLDKQQYEIIVELVIEIINDALFIKDGMKQLQIYKFIEKFHSYLKEYLPKYNLSFSDEFVKSQLFVAMAHGITMKLCKDDFKYLIDETMNELFHTNLFFDYIK
jgi:predicted unusual protein kinase regulating ubiquinone biosynthesis (AarF/ABC1/UbiB family)